MLNVTFYCLVQLICLVGSKCFLKHSRAFVVLKLITFGSCEPKNIQLMQSSEPQNNLGTRHGSKAVCTVTLQRGATESFLVIQFKVSYLEGFFCYCFFKCKIIVFEQTKGRICALLERYCFSVSPELLVLVSLAILDTDCIHFI